MYKNKFVNNHIVINVSECQLLEAITILLNFIKQGFYGVSNSLNGVKQTRFNGTFSTKNAFCADSLVIGELETIGA